MIKKPQQDSLAYLKNYISNCCHQRIVVRQGKPYCDKCDKQCRVQLSFDKIDRIYGGTIETLLSSAKDTR